MQHIFQCFEIGYLSTAPSIVTQFVFIIFVSQVADSNGEFFLKSSELFESPVYLEEVADVLCILQAGTRLQFLF